MKRITRFLKRIRLVYRRSSSLTKAVVLSATVLCMAALIVLSLAIQSSLERTRQLAADAARAEYENQKLVDQIDALGSAEGVEQIAKDNGLVGGDEIIIDMVEDTGPTE